MKKVDQNIKAIKMNFMNKLNKKRLFIPVVLVLITTLLMIPIANAAIQSVVSSQNVTNPNNITGSPDGAYAIFNPSSAQLIGRMGTTPPSTQVAMYAYVNPSNSATVTIYSSSSSTGPWTYVGFIVVNGGPAWYTIGSLIGTSSYIGISTNGGPVYIDAIQP